MPRTRTSTDEQPPHDARGVTLRTIAKAANVHPSTVSRALRRAPDGDATALMIRRIAADLGYRPDFAAASLRTRKSGAIGVLVHHLSDVVQAHLYESIERTALELGYQALVAITHDDPEEQRRRVELMLGRRIDGLIVADAHIDGAYADWLATLGVPFVLALRRSGDHRCVSVDDELGGRLAGAHLANLGHRRVAILAGLPFSSAFVGRTAGCRAALEDRGVAVPDALCLTSSLEPDRVEAALEQMLDHEPGLTAVFAVDDVSAITAMGVLRRRGLVVGVDVAVVGYNDIPMAASLGLTSVWSPNTVMGATAMRMLRDVIAGREVHSIQLAPRLVVRETSLLEEARPRARASTRRARSSRAGRARA